MRISKFKLENFVCFYDPEGKSDDVVLRSGINFIIGKNNSGKTALLDAMTPGVNGEAHRSEANLPERNPVVRPANETTYEIEYEFDDIELRNFIRKEGRDLPIHILRQFQFQTYSNRREGIMNREADEINKYICGVLADGFGARLRYRADNTEQLRFERIEVPTHGNREFEVFHISVDECSNYVLQSTGPHYLNAPGVRRAWQSITNDIPHRIYRFQAERIAASTSSPNHEFYLQPDISNLPQVVKSLKDEETEQYQGFLKHLQTIFPDMHEIVAITSENEVELRISYYRPSQRRPDLAVSLSECGTGLSQVMAMLYVVVTSETPLVILIDEPYSFLHPGAVRELLKIFQQHDHHQYIIATHSPTAIMSVKHKRILLVTRENMVSSVKSVNVHDNTELEDMLREIGSSRSDIFGMDAYIWVEGSTDVACFNLIMDAREGLPDGVQILNLVNPDDLKRSKDAGLVEQIYERLSGGAGILPSALAFIFDGDKRPADYNEIDDSESRTHYLKRQNYESYLIEPSILAGILNRDSVEDKCGHTTESVSDWIRETNDGYDYDNTDWLEAVDGAKFLDELFNCLGGISYDNYKVAYGEEITKHILAANPDHFQEIVDLITSVIEKDNQPEFP